MIAGEAVFAMGLVSPALLLGGAGLMSLPLLIHLFSRRRFRRVAWAATSFLLAAERHNRRRVRLEQMILLALRCLAMGLIGMLLARPFLQSRAWGELLGGVARTERVFVLDDTYSMRAVAGADSVFDQARERLAESVQAVHRDLPNDPLTVLVASRPATPLVAGAYLDGPRLNDLLHQIEALTVSETGDLYRVFEVAASMLSRNEGAGSAAIHIISDFQRKDWVPRPDPEDSASPLTPFSGGIKGRGVAALLFQEVGPSGRDNLAVTGLEALQRRFVSGTVGRIEARITNYGEKTADDVRLRVYLDGGALAEQPRLRIEARGTVSIPLELPIPEEGSHVVRVELGPDVLEADNSRQMSLTVDKAVRVLIVNGEPAPEASRDEAALLAAALRPEGPVRSGNEIDVVDEVDFSGLEVAGYDVLILANVYGVTEETRVRVEAYAERGGGVIFFLGDQVDASYYNTAFYREGTGLFPLHLDEPFGVSAEETSPGLRMAGASHPLTRLFSGEQNPLTGRLHFWQYHGSEVRFNDQAGQGAAESKGETRTGSALSQPVRPRVLLQYDDESGSPALVESEFGTGRVLVFTSSCDQEWNDWAQSPSYVVTMLEMVQYLARPASGIGSVSVGKPIHFRLDPARYEPAVRLYPPGAGPTTGTQIPAEADPAGETLQVAWNHTERSGAYRFELTDRAGGKHDRLVAVNCDPVEGDLKNCTREELSRIGSQVAGRVGFGPPETGRIDTADGQRELWPTLVIFLGAVLLSEQGLAWWFGKRSS